MNNKYSLLTIQPTLPENYRYHFIYKKEKIVLSPFPLAINKGGAMNFTLYKSKIFSLPKDTQNVHFMLKIYSKDTRSYVPAVYQNPSFIFRLFGWNRIYSDQSYYLYFTEDKNYEHCGETLFKWEFQIHIKNEITHYSVAGYRDYGKIYTACTLYQVKE